MDFNVASADGLVVPIVINERTVRVIRDLDLEGVWTGVKTRFPVDRGQHERVVASSIDRACSLELATTLISDHQPLGCSTVEIKSACLKLKMCIACRDCSA